MVNQLFPAATTVGNAGLFSNPSTYGLVQGSAYPDPATRWRLRAAILDASETTPMWGGCAVYAHVPGAQPGPVVALGPRVGKATAVAGATGIAGFSVFDQSYNMVNTPQSTAPQAQPGQSVNYYPIGSGARITVACDPALLSMQGGPLLNGGALAWDFANQRLIAGAALGVWPFFQLLDVQTTNCVIVAYDAPSGNTNWQFTGGACAVIQI